MPLTAGARLGAYEILAPLGAGGMGEVFRARDTELNRDVAIKMLPSEFAFDADRLARFKREAQLLASLSHPNIAHIYGLERQERQDRQEGQEGREGREGRDATEEPAWFLVMELVEGEDLAQRIARGPVPLDEALAIANQIAEALEAAHDKGVVHRDLKPANVRVTSADTVKVLDFGLAKLIETDPAVVAGASANPSRSPTLSVHATFAGMILGTAAYMSPEQARGRVVDRRTDIWAFGCVLFEMLSGARAFDGDDIPETIGAVIHKEPAWDKLPAATPPAVRLVLQRCLEKDPKRRVRDIGDVHLALGGAFESSTPPLPVEAPPPSQTRTRSLLLAAGAGAAVAATIAAAGFLLLRSPTPALQPIRFTIAPPAAQPLNLQGFFRQIAISPDGTRIAYIAGGDAVGNGSQLMIRATDQLDSTAVRGATGAVFPFFSPDGRWIGFFTGGSGELKKVSITGGVPITLCRYQLPADCPLPDQHRRRGDHRRRHAPSIRCLARWTKISDPDRRRYWRIAVQRRHQLDCGVEEIMRRIVTARTRTTARADS